MKKLMLLLLCFGASEFTMAQKRTCPGTISSTSHTDATCAKLNDGSITILPAGLQYRIGTTNINTFQSGNTFSNLAPGNYYVQVKSGNCYEGISVGVGVLSTVNESLSKTDESCIGKRDGSITATGSGGTPPYQFKLGTVGVYSATNVFSGLRPGTYSVYVKDANNCGSKSMSITISPSIKVCTPCINYCSNLPLSFRNHLVAYYPFCSNANDVSGNNNNPSYNNATLTNDRFGNLKSAYSFDSRQFIKGSCTNFPVNSRTISIWFMATDLSRHNTLFGYGGGTCGTSFFEVLNVGNHLNQYTVSGHCEVNNCSTSDQYPPQTGWNNLVVTTGIDSTKLYLNGILIHTFNGVYFNGTDVIGKAFAIGSLPAPSGFAPYTDSNVDFFEGVLDDIVIYDTVLNEVEVQNLYQYFNTACPGFSSPPNNFITSKNNGFSPFFSSPISKFAKPDQKPDGTTFTASLYPNPTGTQFTLRVHGVNNQPVTVRVTDANGRGVYATKGFAEQPFKFGETFAPGIYLVVVRQGNEIKTLKAVKLK